MANKKISELPYIGVSKISGNTLVPLVTYFSATTGDTVHTFVDDFQTYLISGLTGNTDVFVTGGTYSAGTITFTNNTGGTFNITGLTTGSTSIISGEYLPLSGGTVTGSTEFSAGLSANTISATTYLNLPITTDVFVTGGTYTNGDATFTNNTGGTFSVTGFTQPFSGGSGNCITDLYTSNLYGCSPIVVHDNLELVNGVFLKDQSGLSTIDISSGSYNQYIFGTGNNQTNIYQDNTVVELYATYNGYVDNNIGTVGISVVRNGGGTWSNPVLIQGNYDNNVYHNISPYHAAIFINSVNSATLSGITGTVILGGENMTATTSNTTYVDNLNINTIGSGTSVINLGLDVNGNVVTGTTGGGTFTGGTVTGETSFTNGLTANTISATTYQNLPDNVTGNYLPLSGGTVSGNTTITADLTVSGNSGINWFSSNTSSDLVRITQTGVGNAFVVEDNTNPDSTPFIINSGGSVSVGTTSVFSVGGGTETKLNVSNGSSGVVTTGLTTATPLVVESNLTSSIGMISPDNQVSQIYFGTPSDALGSVLRWDYTKRDFSLGTSTTSGKLIFLTGSYDEVARIDQSGNMGIGLTGATQKLEVSGNTRIYGSMSAQTGYISGSGQNILTVIGSGNSTTSPLFSVQGSSGELFSVTDSLVGSLFSVNDISGLPIMEVFSDNTTLWGSYQAPSLNTTTRTSLTAGTNTIYSIPTSAYTGAFFEYTLISSGATGARAGQIMSIWSGSTANFTETSTTDIGTTTGVTFTVAISGNNAVLSSSATTAGWTVKTIIRSI